MIDFSTLQGLTIPEGVVTEIKDASGRVIWAVSGGKVILEVEKITSDTYAGETTYTGEQFILLDIYPKTNGTVKVTYGGLTKTITETTGSSMIMNATQVFFGTFNGVTDDVATPANGTLTIEGDCTHFAVGTYKSGSKSVTQYCSCVTAIVDFGCIESLGNFAFRDCSKITNVTIPDVRIDGHDTFTGCTGLVSLTIENGVDKLANSMFYGCTGLTSVTIPSSVTTINEDAFSGCTGLTTVTFANTSGWYVTETSNGDASTGTAVNVSDPVNNVTLITDTYASFYWYRS